MKLKNLLLYNKYYSKQEIPNSRSLKTLTPLLCHNHMLTSLPIVNIILIDPSIKIMIPISINMMIWKLLVVNIVLGTKNLVTVLELSVSVQVSK